MTRLYRWLLLLYPADYRAMFAAEMAEVFDKANDGACEQGAWQRVMFCVRELTGLVRAASNAQIRNHAAVRWVEPIKAPANGRLVVTSLIFAFMAVIAAIEILKSFAFHRRHSRPIVSHEFPLAILEWLLLAYGVGVIGWTITFLAHRTGMHRLANADTKVMED